VAVGLEGPKTERHLLMHLVWMPVERSDLVGWFIHMRTRRKQEDFRADTLADRAVA